jgi:dolichyl-phosphate beta-glucosyltransferase
VSARGTPFLSIVLPVYNEEAYLERAVSEIAARMAAAGFPYEMLIVDDGSTDGTLERALDLARRYDARGRCGDLSPWSALRVISYGPNRGKGRAVRSGVLASSGRFVVFMDADLSTSPAYIPAFLVEAASGCDVVTASRRLPGSRTEPPQGPLRRLAGRIYTRLAGRFLGLPPGTTDVSCGFKLFRGEVARGLFARQRLEGWAFDAEILFLARHASLRVKELPVRWRNRADSRVRVLRDTLGSLLELLRVKRIALAGGYGPVDLPAMAPASPAPDSAPGPPGLGARDPAEAGAGVGSADRDDLLRRS